ncbi:MAG: rod shape-determining protein MreD [Pseudomonadota bacterium]
MGSAGTAYIWSMRAAFAGVAVFTLLVHLLPLETQPRGWVAPDVLLALTLAWTMRRPDIVPVALVAVVFLLADFLLQRPPGLFTGLVVVASEVARYRHDDIRETLFLFEWLTAAALMVGVYLAYLIVLGIVSPTPISASLVVLQGVFTILAYPLVVGLSQSIFGIRIAAPGEVDERGRRL